MKASCLIFRDPDFEAPREYTAEDISEVLLRNKRRFLEIGHRELARLSRELGDILIVPYIRGNFSEKSLRAMELFHAAGGSLFFLGDLPNRDQWYPLRQMQAYRLHIARCYDDVSISADCPELHGLTSKGREILGELKDPAFFRGRQLPGLRLVAYPPDESHALLAVNSASHTQQSSAVMVTERKCDKFFGAKFAAIGFIGGEPRENVAGVYYKDWTYDPGLLTRRWKGINDMVLKLLDWLEPKELAVSIDVPPLARETEEAIPRVRIRNFGKSPGKLKNCEFRSNGELLYDWSEISVKGKEIASISLAEPIRGFGIHRCEFRSKGRLLGENIARVIPHDAASHAGYGFSTYWAFQRSELVPEFKHFCREMLKRGCQYVRANIPWEDIEPEPGKYDWSIPDQMLNFAAEENFQLQFWLFPTTRGSGLSDGGVPEWSLREPAIDRDGNPGNFPSIWSPFYRKHYFGMVEAICKRYAKAEKLNRLVIDFGNSDFAYGYYYYVNDTSLFDYSEHERVAFSRFMRENLGWDLDIVSQVFGREFKQSDDIPIPLVKDKEAWSVYLDFRAWSVHQGIKHVHDLIRRFAPDKLPPDLPGHGLGSISNIGTYFSEAKAKHWREERKFDSRYTSMHNGGETWGGEPWQVGGDYRQYDDALFMSVRLNATYFSIPGADLCSYGEDIARIGFIRRTLMGATRKNPELAVFDREEWDNYHALTTLAARLDFPVDLLCRRHRYDFSCYKLMTMPDNDFLDVTATGGGGGMLVPDDEAYYWLLRESVEKGLNLLLFPKSCEIRKSGVQRTFLRQNCDLLDVRYGARKKRTVKFPQRFGGGIMSGHCRSVNCAGEVLVRDSGGEPVLVRRELGKGAILLAGWDTMPDSLDQEMNPEKTSFVKQHTLIALCRYLGIASCEFRSNGLFAYKEMIHRNGRDYFLVYSHLPGTVRTTFQLFLSSPAERALDLATGETFPLKKRKDGWHTLRLPLTERRGRYLSFHDKN